MQGSAENSKLNSRCFIVFWNEASSQKRNISTVTFSKRRRGRESWCHVQCWCSNRCCAISIESDQDWGWKLLIFLTVDTQKPSRHAPTVWYDCSIAQTITNFSDFSCLLSLRCQLIVPSNLRDDDRSLQLQYFRANVYCISTWSSYSTWYTAKGGSRQVKWHWISCSVLG